MYDYTKGHSSNHIADPYASFLSWDSTGVSGDSVAMGLRYGRYLARPNGMLKRLSNKLLIPLRNLAAGYRLQCETNGLYAAVSIGDIVEVPGEKPGSKRQAVIIGYVIKPRTQEYIEFKDAKPGARGKIKTRKTPAIRNLQVRINQDPRSSIVSDGVTFGYVEAEPTFETVELDPDQTKEVIIARMIQTGHTEHVVRAYPEERAHLRAWVAKYPPPVFRMPPPRPVKPAPTPAARTRRR